MTALTISAQPGNDTALRPVPWRRMAWVTWRQHRLTLAGVGGVLGALGAAPVLARELETGPFRYAWTQGFGRGRWTLAKLAPLAVTLAAAAVAFSVLFSWYFTPFADQGLQTRLPPLAPLVFDLHGVAVAAWTLAACSIGALAGMLIRRVVPAIAATMAAWAGLALAAGLFLRQHYLTPLFAHNPNLPGSAWIISSWYTGRDGKPLSQAVVSQ